MLPVGTRSMAGAQGTPRALHCTFCCCTGAARGIAETTWIPKATAVSRDYSPAAARSYLEDGTLRLHSQYAVQSYKRNFALTSSSQGLAEGSQERQPLPLNLLLTRRQSQQSDAFQQLMNKGKQEIRGGDGEPAKPPVILAHWCPVKARGSAAQGASPSHAPGSAWPSFHDP